MSVFVWLDENNRVLNRSWNPNKLTEEQKQGGVEVKKLPSWERKVGERPVYYYDEETEKVYVEYQEKPLTEEELEMEEGKALVEDELITDMTERGVL